MKWFHRPQQNRHMSNVPSHHLPYQQCPPEISASVGTLDVQCVHPHTHDDSHNKLDSTVSSRSSTEHLADSIMTHHSLEADENSPLLVFTSSTPALNTTTTHRQYRPLPFSRRLLQPQHLNNNHNLFHPHCERAVSVDAIHRCFYHYGSINIDDILAGLQETETPASEAVSQENKQLSNMQAILIMTNCVIDMGLLNFPYAFKTAGGIENALIVQMVVISFILISLLMVGYCAKMYSSTTYQAMVRAHCGEAWATFSKACICLNNFTACILFLVVLGDQLERVVSMTVDQSQQNAFYFRRACLVPVLSTIFILPMATMKNFSIFRYTGFVGILAALFIAFGVAVTRYVTGTVATPPGPYDPQHDAATEYGVINWVRILPVFLFAYECHIEVPPLFACLQRPTLSNYMVIAVSYTAVAFCIYMTVAIFAYLTFGDAVSSDFLLTYPKEDVLVMVAMALLAVKIATTYPVVFYCVRIIGEEVTLRPRLRTICGDISERTRRYAVSVMFFTGSVIIAVVVPTITEVIALVGGIAALFLFFFPGICYASIHRHVYGWQGMSNFALGVFFAVLGVGMAVLTTSVAIYDYATSTSPHVHNVTLGNKMH